MWNRLWFSFDQPTQSIAMANSAHQKYSNPLCWFLGKQVAGKREEKEHYKIMKTVTGIVYNLFYNFVSISCEATPPLCDETCQIALFALGTAIIPSINPQRITQVRYSFSFTLFCFWSTWAHCSSTDGYVPKHPKLAETYFAVVCDLLEKVSDRFEKLSGQTDSQLLSSLQYAIFSYPSDSSILPFFFFPPKFDDTLNFVQVPTQRYRARHYSLFKLCAAAFMVLCCGTLCRAAFSSTIRLCFRSSWK